MATELPNDIIWSDPEPAQGTPARAGGLPSDVMWPDETTLGDYPIEAAKGVAQGAKDTLGVGLKGTGVVIAAGEQEARKRALSQFDAIDNGAKIRLNDDIYGYGSMNPEQRKAMRADLEQQIATEPALNENPLYKAGAAVSDFGNSVLAPKPGFEGSWTRDIASGFGSVGAGIVMSMLSPTAAGLMFVGAGSGEAADNAIKAGATKEQIATAARLGTLPGATDVVDALLPALGTTGKVLGFAKRVGWAAIKGALAEGGQEGLQQFMQNAIARGVYDPNKDLGDDVPRSALIGAIVGGTVAGGMGALDRQRTAAPATPPGAPTGPSGAPGALPADVILPTEAEPPGGAPPPGAPPVAAAPVGSPGSTGHTTIVVNGENRPDLVAKLPVHAGLTRAVEVAEGKSPIEQALQGAPETPPAVAPTAESANLGSPLEATADGVLTPVNAPEAGTPSEVGGKIDTAANPPNLSENGGNGDGTRAAPVKITNAEDVSRAAAQAATDYTPEQGEANNRTLGHAKWHGLDASIEVAAGGTRSGTVPKTGEAWSTTHTDPYGYWKGTKGADGMHVDVSFGPNVNDPALPAYVIDEMDPKTGKFRQHKTFVGFANPESAVQSYLGTSSKTPDMVGGLTALPIKDFTDWVQDESKTTKRLSPAAAVSHETPAPKAAKPAKPRAPLTILQFIAKRGGIDPTDPLIGDVRAILGKPNRLIPGGGMLIRKSGGKRLDSLREAAAEAGYFGPGDGAMATTTVRHLLDLMRDQDKGRASFSDEDALAGQDNKEAKAHAAEDERLAAAKAEITDLGSQLGITNLTEQEIERAAKHALVNGLDYADALEEIVEQTARETDAKAVAYDSERDNVPDDAYGADDFREEDAGQGEQPARPAAAVAEGNAPVGEQSGEAEQAATEGAEGAQPQGAERAEDAPSEAAPAAENPEDLALFEPTDGNIRKAIAYHTRRQQGAEEFLRKKVTANSPPAQIAQFLASSSAWGAAMSAGFSDVPGVLGTENRSGKLQLWVRDGSPRGKKIELKGTPLADHIKALYAPIEQKDAPADNKVPAAKPAKPDVLANDDRPITPPEPAPAVTDDDGLGDVFDAAVRQETQTPEEKEAADIATRIRATGMKGSEGFATGIEGALKKGMFKAESLPFYREKLREFEAKTQATDAPTISENYTLADILAMQKEDADAYRKIMELGQPKNVAAALQVATDKVEQLRDQLNAAGFKVNDINSFNASDKPEVQKAKRHLSEIGGASARLLKGLATANGNVNVKRVQDDIRGLRDTVAGTITEATDIGDQGVIPGAEQIGQGEHAQRKANEKLKPRVAQRPADNGLFGDGHKQTDLMDTLNAKPRSTGESAKSALKNTGMGLSDVAKGLDALFNPGNKLSSGLTFDEDTYAKAKPFFKSGVAHFAEAGKDVADMVRELVRHLVQTAKMDKGAIEAMKPYILRFVRDVRDGKESLNAPSLGGNLEQDSGNATAGDGVGGANVSPAGGGSPTGPRSGGEAPRPEDGSPTRSDLSENHAPVVGADGNLELPERQPEPETRPPGSGGRGGSDLFGGEGLPPDRPGAAPATGAVDRQAELARRRKAQDDAETIKVKDADRDNISETLPMLFPEQQDDVLKAEQRFAKPDGHGMLFTNGTGTGKTFSGLGVIKRFVKQGKENVLIVAPSQGILLDWQKAAATLGIKATILDGIADKGKGVTLTTYANLGENRTLADRDWDLVVPDETHKLSSGQGGDATAALATFRALTLHPKGMNDRARMVLRKEWAAVEAINKNDIEAKGKAYREFEAKAKPLIEKWTAAARPKALMLSATPFSYHFSLDYAEGYLFDYGPEPQGGGYNTPDARSAFYITNFGYRMRTGSLTKPEADVRSEIMEREFHEKLKREGSLSGRALEVDKDYDRKFVVVDDAVGHDIDAALEFLQSADNGKFRPLYEKISKKFDYLSRMRLLEAIKARHAIPYIKESFALGRKVVVFHDYNEGGGFSPFTMTFAGDETQQVYQGGQNATVNLSQLYAEFLSRNPGVDDLAFSGFRAPIAELTAAFPDALVYNGRVSKKNRDLAKAMFNDDNSGRNLIIVQSAAGEFGISLHDITGIKQRTLLNLGMPIRPTSAIQQEGRIYRVGQASDAIFRYMNTGTNWERWTFAGTIADRAGTAENLALGNQARTIRQSFIDAFNNADDNPPEAGEGKGGKEIDRANNNALSEFEKAKTHYFAQSKVRGKRDQREGKDYFATPEPIGLKMVEFARLQPGERVLEPSAGHGAIARYFPEDSSRTLVEPSSGLASRAALTSPGARVVVDRFENFNVVNKYNAIIMNPPFGHGGATAMEHLAKAAKHLVNGGRIVALIPRGGMADKGFDRFMDSDAAKGIYQVAEYHLPAVTFERAGTGANTRIVVLEKQTDPEVRNRLQLQTRDYSDAEKISELFDRIEHSETPPRLEPVTKEAAVDENATTNLTVGGVELKLSGKDIDDVPALMAEIVGRVDRGKFAELARAAEANNGSYSKVLKAFRFEKAEDRQAFLDRVANPPAAPTAEPGEPIKGVEFKTGETKHSKTGANLFVATMTSRVERDVYDAVNAAAKKHGGYYSSYTKQGAIAGFQFKSAEARKAFVDDVNGAKDDGTIFSAAPDTPTAPPFYSAVARAVEGVKLTKAPAVQWLNTLRNVPGVKAEEMEWLGLADWLKEQKGAVTKDAVLDYVKANQIEVKEVEKGGEVPKPAIKAISEWVQKHHPSFYDQEPFEDGLRGGAHQAIEDMEALGVPDELMKPVYDNINGGAAKFGDRVLPGGENYRELLLTLPPRKAKLAKVADLKAQGWTTKVIKENDFTGQREVHVYNPAGERVSMRSGTRRTPDEVLEDHALSMAGDESKAAHQEANFKGGHFDEPNIVAHVRFNDRTIDGKRTLFVEEVQSDWHQKGRKGGYSQPGRVTQRDALQNMWSNHVNAGTQEGAEGQAILRELRNYRDESGRVPDAPFKTTWPELAMKRMIRYAAENGYDAVAWTPGAVQNDRYDLSKQIRELRVTKEDDGSGGHWFKMDAVDPNGRVVHIPGIVKEPDLPEAIGKEMADRIIKDNIRLNGQKVYSGLDLKVGGEGMVGFYDKMLPAMVNKLVKKFGAKVGTAPMEAATGNKTELPYGWRAEQIATGRWVVGDAESLTLLDDDVLETEFGAFPTREAAIAAALKGGVKEQTQVHTLPITDDLRAAAVGQGFPMFAPKGWESVGASEPQRLTEADVAKANEIVKRVAGIDPRFAETIDIPAGSIGAMRWGKTTASKASGAYSPASDAITLALDQASGSRAGYHEAFHRLQHKFLNPRERELLLRENEKLKSLLRNDVAGRDPSRMDSEEVEAEAFAVFSMNKDAGKATPGLNNNIARAWGRIRNFVQRLRNALNGLGYRTLEDVFERAHAGAYANRTANPVGSNGKPLFSQEVGADGKPQLTIPGTEKITDKTLAERKAAEPKRATKAQKDVDGLPLFGDSKNQGELFSLAQEPSTATERHQVSQGFLARGQFIDRAIRTSFDIFGGVDAQGSWKPGKYLWEKHPAAMTGALVGARMGATLSNPIAAAAGHAAGRVIGGKAGATVGEGIAAVTGGLPGAAVGAVIGGAGGILLMARFSPQGRFAFMNPVLETARSGLLDRYNLRNLPDYVERERQISLDERAKLLTANEILQSMKNSGVGPAEAKILHAMITEGEVAPAEIARLSAPIQAAIEEWGQEAVRYGLVSPESFERYRGVYMNRSYRKHELDENGLVRLVNKIGGSYRKRIIGNQLKGRGIFQEIELSRLMKDVPDWHAGARGKPENGEKFIRLDEMPSQAQLALDANLNPEKPLRIVYWPADRAIPDQYAGFVNRGTFEKRGEKGGKIVIWRDFTKAERTDMGEILDARYTFAKTAIGAAHDLAIGKFYHDIAQNEDWASKAPPEGRIIDAAEWSRGAHGYRNQSYDWVRVPDTNIPDTGGKKKYGALAGMHVREEIWRDLHEIDTATNPGAIAGFWRSVLRQWKLNKTARTPTVHVNNVMSNFMLMDLMDVRGQDFVKGVRSYATGDAEYEEAMRNGAFGADMISKEIRENTLKPILDELLKQSTAPAAQNNSALGVISRFAELLWKGAKKGDAWMKQAYQVEDEVFRMATYLRRRQLGDDAKTAAQVARQQFIDYDIRAPWVRVLRNSVLPFISYTYRAVPIVAEAVAHRPWKIAKYAILGYAVNALAYGLTGGDEDKERRALREQEQGRTWAGTARLIRLWNGANGDPRFLDTRNWMPAGNVADFGDGDVPPWLMFGGPMIIGGELALNRSAFTGQEIFNTKTDDWWERQQLRAGHAAKSFLPNAPWVPYSWAWDKIGSAAVGGTDRAGTPYSLPLAATNSVGLKIKPLDVDDAMTSKGQDFDSTERALKDRERKFQRLHGRDLVSDSALEREMERIDKKRERLKEKADETFK